MNGGQGRYSLIFSREFPAGVDAGVTLPTPLSRKLMKNSNPSASPIHQPR